MIPHIVEETMNRLSNALHAKTSVVESIYLYGSTALGDYVEGSSDIDFMAILRHPPSEEDIAAIASAHAEVEANLPNTDMMGAYMLADELGKSYGEISVLLTYYEKRFRTDRSGADINPVTWWILKHHGLRVYGPGIAFRYETDPKHLADYVIANLNTYWVGWIERLEHQLNGLPEEVTAEQLDFAVEWCTLGMLRQLYTVKEQGVKSKIAAGDYGLQVIPAKWHHLIEEAISIKKMNPVRFYYDNVVRLTDLIALLQYIHSEANRIFSGTCKLQEVFRD